jgi:predicted PurR-regulated permease PerM
VLFRCGNHLPIVVAFVLMLVFQPVMRMLGRLRIPRGVAAGLIILIFFGALAGIAMMLSGPAVSWAQKLPSGIPKLQERLSFLSEPIAGLQGLISRAERLSSELTTQSSPLSVTVAGAGLSDRLIDGTRYALSATLETVLVLFFLLIAGTHSSVGWSRSCPPLKTSGGPSRSPSRSRATLQPI